MMIYAELPFGKYRDFALAAAGIEPRGSMPVRVATPL